MCCGTSCRRTPASYRCSRSSRRAVPFIWSSPMLSSARSKRTCASEAPSASHRAARSPRSAALPVCAGPPKLPTSPLRAAQLRALVSRRAVAHLHAHRVCHRDLKLEKCAHRALAPVPCSHSAPRLTTHAASAVVYAPPGAFFLAFFWQLCPQRCRPDERCTGRGRRVDVSVCARCGMRRLGGAADRFRAERDVGDGR
jgi:hypothetical protein